MLTYTTCIVSFHDKIPVFAKGRSPTVPDDPLFLFSLSYDSYGVVKRLLRTVSESIRSSRLGQ